MKFKRVMISLSVICSLLISLLFVLPASASQPNDNISPAYNPLDPIIDNGTIQLGINPEGHLNVPGGTPSMPESSTTSVGIRYIPTNGEGTAPGCLCEGWGVANADSATGIFSGYANVASDGGAHNLTLSSETEITNTTGQTQPESSGSAFKSVVTTEDRLKITHHYKPSASPNLYVAEVTIENIGDQPVGDLRYRRVMDWDIAPHTFWEHVEMHIGNASNVILAATDGFLSANPLASAEPYAGSPATTLYPGSPDYVSSYPSDQGSLFDFTFGALNPGETKKFNIFYGATETREEALSALSTVGAEVYSFGIPSNDDGSAALNGPHTFIFAFGSVGGEAVDTIAPKTQLYANSAIPTTGWYNTDTIDVELAAKDNESGSGVDKTFYRVNGGAFKEYTAPFTLSGSNTYKVDYYSQDLAGNVEKTNTIKLGIDKDAPKQTKYSVKPVWETKAGKKYIKGYTYTLTGSDSKSGIKEIYYRINDGEWQLYTGPFQAFGTPNLKVDFYSVDNAGNKEIVP